MVETLRLSERLALEAPDGTPVELLDVRVRLEREGEHLVDIWLIGEATHETWSRIDEHAWFHLSPAVRGPSFGGPFDPAALVRIEARLAPDRATALALLSDDEWAVLAELLGARVLGDLHQTESWFGLYVTQAHGPVRGGFRTRHADRG